MFVYFYLIFSVPLLLVFCIFLNCSQSESEKKIQDLEDKVKFFDCKLKLEEDFSLMLSDKIYDIDFDLTKSEKELKKIKKEIKK